MLHLRTSWQGKPHPCVCCVLLTVGVPLAMVAAVFLSTLVVMLPISLVMGWV